MLSVFARLIGSKTPTSTLTPTDTLTSTPTPTFTSTVTLTPTTGPHTPSTATSTDTPCGYGSCAHYKACYIFDNSECFFGQTSSKCPELGGELDLFLTVDENSLAPTFASYSNFCFYLYEEFVPISECGKVNGRFPYDATYCGGTNLSFYNQTEYNDILITDISDIFDYEHSSCESCCGCITPTVTQYIHPPTATNYNIEHPPTPTPTIISNCDHCENLDPDVICPPRPTLTPKETFISALSTNPIFIFYENNCYYKTETEYDLNRVYNPIGHDDCDSCYSLNFYRL